VKSRAFSWEIHDLVGQFIAAFDDVVIGRFNRNREEKDRIEVAYVYQPKARVLHDIENRAQNLKLPIGSVVIESVSRNNNRAFNKIEGFTYPARRQDRFSKTTVKIPPVVPVDIKVKLSLLATYQTDIDQLISNFAAYANPYIIISWKVPEEFGLPASMPLNSKVEWDGNISLGYPVDINHSARSVITADATFTIEGWLFKDIVDPINNIFFIDANFYNTRILSAGNFITYDDYATLSGADYSYSEGQLKVTEVDTVSISGSPTITNVFFTPQASDRGSFPLIDTNYTTNSAAGNIVLYGKRFNYTRNVYISSNNPNLYTPLTAVSFTYFPSFTAAPIPASSYRVITDNIMEITVPALTSVGRYTFIVDTVVGWDSTFSGMSGYFIRPGYGYAGVNCESNTVTLYTNNNTFSPSSTAYSDSELSTRYTGYFIINNNTYSYTNGVGTLSSCPVYAYPGTICNGTNVTIFTLNSSFRVNSTAYTDRGVSATYTGYFSAGGFTYSYINGAGILSACPTTDRSVAYISNSGNDGTGDVGNLSLPFRTLSGAAAALDIEYPNSNVTISLINSNSQAGQNNANITSVADRLTIDGNGYSISEVYIDRANSGLVALTLDGVTITNLNFKNRVLGDPTDIGTIRAANNPPTINNISANGEAGIAGAPGSEDDQSGGAGPDGNDGYYLGEGEGQVSPTPGIEGYSGAQATGGTGLNGSAGDNGWNITFAGVPAGTVSSLFAQGGNGGAGGRGGDAISNGGSGGRGGSGLPISENGATGGDGGFGGFAQAGSGGDGGAGGNGGNITAGGWNIVYYNIAGGSVTPGQPGTAYSMGGQGGQGGAGIIPGANGTDRSNTPGTASPGSEGGAGGSGASGTFTP
jgi:hypothetical protein